MVAEVPGRTKARLVPTVIEPHLPMVFEQAARSSTRHVPTVVEAPGRTKARLVPMVIEPHLPMVCEPVADGVRAIRPQQHKA